jgi:hypothetical protein
MSKLTAELRGAIMARLQAGVLSPSDICRGNIISPSALSRFLNGSDDSGLRMQTFEKLIDRLKGAVEILWGDAVRESSFIRNPQNSTIAESDHRAIESAVRAALSSGPAAIFGRNGECYAVNMEFQQLIGLVDGKNFFQLDTDLFKDRYALLQFLGIPLSTAASNVAAANSGTNKNRGIPRQTPLHFFELNPVSSSRLENVEDSEKAEGMPFCLGAHACLLECEIPQSIQKEFHGELLVVSFSDASQLAIQHREVFEERKTLWQLINDPANQIRLHVVEPGLSSKTQKLDKTTVSSVSLMTPSAKVTLKIASETTAIRLTDFVEKRAEDLQAAMEQKFRGDGLTKNESRTFIRLGRPRQMLPVAISDYGVPNVRVGKPDEPFFSRIITVWRETSVPSDILKIFEVYGARNPVLSSVGIESVVKRRHASTVQSSSGTPSTNESDYEILYMNERHRQNVSVQVPADLELEKPFWESEIFKKNPKLEELMRDYHRCDNEVLENAESGGSGILERIENHPYPKQTAASSQTDGASGQEDLRLVHVVKIPVKEHMRSSESALRWVLHVFFWPAASEERVYAALREFYSAWRILEAIPIPVYAKDQFLRLIYANRAYIKDVVETAKKCRPENAGVGRTVKSVRDICGRSDSQFFPPAQFTKYEQDDRKLIHGFVTEVNDVEEHGEQHRMVRVWKRPLKLLRGTDSGSKNPLGIVGIYCDEPTGKVSTAGESKKRKRGRPLGSKSSKKRSEQPE